VRAAGLDARVTLHGAVPYRDVPALYRRATALVSASRTGSVDKVVLEAMACERPVLTCNDAFPRLLAELGAEARALGFPPGDAGALAQRVGDLLDRPEAERAELGRRLRRIVARDHEVDALMGRLCAAMEP
jgi:glycosyltransferase involved in cell wall biosynthesis